MNAEQRREPSRRAVIAALGCTQILAWGSSVYLLAVLARPIVAETGWPLAWVIGGYSLGLFAAGAVSPRVGRVIDRSGGRSVLAASSVLMALGLVGLALAQSLPAYLAAWLVLGCGMGAGLYDAAFATLGRLYGAAARPAITALTLFGGFASTVSWPASAVLVEALGWRSTCLVYAGLNVAVALPLHLLVLPRAPTAVASPEPEAGTPKPLSAPISGPRRGPVLVALASVLILFAAASSTIAVHLIALLQARGLDLAAAVALAALVGPSQVGARTVEMAFGRRYHPLWTMLAATGLAAAGLGLLLVGAPLIALALVLYGAGLGLRSIAQGTLPLALFGPAGYATLMGHLARPSLVAQALSPPAAALILERAGPEPVLALLAAFALASLVLMGWLWVASAARG